MNGARRTPYETVTLCAMLGVLFLSGCVRIAGTAGYWHTNSESGATAKQTGFDTAEYIPGNSTPGKITV